MKRGEGGHSELLLLLLTGTKGLSHGRAAKFDEALLGLTSISTQNENISERSDLWGTSFKLQQAAET